MFIYTIVGTEEGWQGGYDCPEGLSSGLGEGFFDVEVKVGEGNVDSTRGFLECFLIGRYITAFSHTSETMPLETNGDL